MTRHFSELPPAGRIYLCAVIGSGALVIVLFSRFARSVPHRLGLASSGCPDSPHRVLQHQDPVGQCSPLRLRSLRLCRGAPVRVACCNRNRCAGLPDPYELATSTQSIVLRAMFNLAAGTLAISFAGRILDWMVPVHPAALAPLDQLVLPVLLLALSTSRSTAGSSLSRLAFEQQDVGEDIWRQNFLWFGLNYLGGASVALVLVGYARNVNVAVLGVIVPLSLSSILPFEPRGHGLKMQQACRHRSMSSTCRRSRHSRWPSMRRIRSRMATSDGFRFSRSNSPSDWA